MMIGLMPPIPLICTAIDHESWIDLMNMTGMVNEEVTSSMPQGSVGFHRCETLFALSRTYGQPIIGELLAADLSELVSWLISQPSDFVKIGGLLNPPSHVVPKLWSTTFGVSFSQDHRSGEHRRGHRVRGKMLHCQGLDHSASCSKIVQQVILLSQRPNRGVNKARVAVYNDSEPEGFCPFDGERGRGHDSRRDYSTSPGSFRHEQAGQT